jgi:hypothetical protein
MMSDDADRADAEVEQMLVESLYRLRTAAAAPVMLFDGGCYCGELARVRFCGKDCRDEYDRDARLRRISGKP